MMPAQETSIRVGTVKWAISKYTHTFTVERYVEDDHLEDIDKVITERTNAKLRPRYQLGGLARRRNTLQYDVSGTLDEVAEARKQLRRLSRGKPRFKVHW